MKGWQSYRRSIEHGVPGADMRESDDGSRLAFGPVPGRGTENAGRFGVYDVVRGRPVHRGTVAHRRAAVYWLSHREVEVVPSPGISVSLNEVRA